MEHIWTVVCEKSITDSRSNNISLINVIEQIRFAPQEGVQTVPITGLEVISMWCRSDSNTPETGNSRTTLLSPSGDELGQDKTIIDLTKYQRIRRTWMFVGFPFTGAGRYHFVAQRQIDDQWETVATVPLEIILGVPEE